MQDDPQLLGPALRLLRARRRLRQYQVAERAGITKAMLSSYENGGTTPSYNSLIPLLGALESDLGGLQQALDMLREGEPLREENEPVPSVDSQLETGSQVVKVARMDEVLILLERIALALEGGGLRQAGGSRPHPRPE